MRHNFTLEKQMKLGFVLGADTYSSSLYNATIDVATEMRQRGIGVEYIFLDLNEPCRDGDKLVNIWGLSRQQKSSKLFIKLMKSLFGYFVYYALFSRFFCKKLEQLAVEHEYDALVFHVTGFSPFYRYRRKHFAVLHTCVYENLIERYRGFKKRFYVWFYRHIYKGQHLLSVSQSAKLDMLEKLGAEPASVNVVFNGFDFSKMKKQASEHNPSLDLPEKFIMAAGRPDRTKRFDVLIEAFAQSESKSTHTLVIFGEGRALSKLKAQARDLGVEQSVIFHGFVNPLLSVYSKADLYVLSSDIEGLPTVVIESLVMGTPVVATDAGGVKELLHGRLSRFVSPRGDARALARNIDEALAESPNVGPELLGFLTAQHVADLYLEQLASHDVSVAS